MNRLEAAKTFRSSDVQALVAALEAVLAIHEEVGDAAILNCDCGCGDETPWCSCGCGYYPCDTAAELADWKELAQ